MRGAGDGFEKELVNFLEGKRLKVDGQFLRARLNVQETFDNLAREVLRLDEAVG